MFANDGQHAANPLTHRLYLEHNMLYCQSKRIQDSEHIRFPAHLWLHTGIHSNAFGIRVPYRRSTAQQPNSNYNNLLYFMRRWVRCVPMRILRNGTLTGTSTIADIIMIINFTSIHQSVHLHLVGCRAPSAPLATQHTCWDCCWHTFIFATMHK